MHKFTFGLCVVLLSSPVFTAKGEPVCASMKKIDYHVDQVIQRSQLGFTEGLTLVGNQLFESSGYDLINNVTPDGISTINSIDLTTGQVAVVVKTPDNDFGEGLQFLNGKFYQLTYQEKKIHVYSKDFGQNQTFPSPLQEGWGLTTDGTFLIATDGGNTIHYIDAKSLKIVKNLRISDPFPSVGNANAEDKALQAFIKKAVTQKSLYKGPNSIALVKDSFYINLFQVDAIIKVDSKTGCVQGYLNLKDLYTYLSPPERTAVQANPEYVPNGVVYDASRDSLYLTGKRWPKFFKVSIVSNFY